MNGLGLCGFALIALALVVLALAYERPSERNDDLDSNR